MNDSSVSISLIGDIPRRFSAPLNTELAHVVEQVAKELLPGVPFATAVGTGATDRPYYASAGITCYGIDPYLVELEDVRREVHGVDERISLQNLEFGLRLHIAVLERMR
jgi:acetylornithine deacetylase/succinyl-diaminopimelate desuccinylase-like protein